MTTTIRPISPDDYDAVCDLWQAAGLSVRPRGRDAQPEFLKQLAAFPRGYLVAEHDGQIVGVVLATHDQRKGWINRLAVRPDFRRTGVARRLLAACEEALRTEGIGIIAALVEEKNAASAKLFADAGYASDIPVRYFHKRVRPDI